MLRNHPVSKAAAGVVGKLCARFIGPLRFLEIYNHINVVLEHFGHSTKKISVCEVIVDCIL